MGENDSTPDNAPGTEVPPELEREPDEKRPAGRPRDAQPDRSDLNDAIAPDSQSGPLRPEDD